MMWREVFFSSVCLLVRGFFHQTVCVCVSRWNSGEGGILFFPRRKVAVHFSQQQRLPETIPSRTAAGVCSVEQSEMNFCTPNTLTHTHTATHFIGSNSNLFAPAGFKSQKECLGVVCGVPSDRRRTFCVGRARAWTRVPGRVETFVEMHHSRQHVSAADP